jgi:tRNA threonylcarbamoyladenosine biosynthesis protein TsaB
VVPGKVTFIEDVNLKITASTFIEMLKRDVLRKVDIYNIKPYYLEKSQAERDKEVGNV